MNRMAVVALAVLLVLGASSLFGQTSADSSGTQKPARWALQFAVDDEQISAYMGTVISLKRIVNAKSSWRVGVSVSIDPGSTSEETDLRLYSSPAETLMAAAYSSSSSNYWISGSCQWLRHFGLVGKSTAFWGVGPIGSYYHYEYASTSISSGAVGYTDERNDYSAGLLLSLGVEWRPITNFGLIGEYGLQPAYQWSKYKSVRREIQAYERRRTSITKSNGIRVDATTVRLGLSVYF